MFRKLTVSVLLFLICACLSFAQPKTTMAVMDLSCAGLSESDGLILTNELLSNIVNTGSFDIVERSRRDEILKEQGFAQSGACDENACLVQFGRYLSVQKMVGGSIGKLGQTWSVNIRLLDVSTGKIDKAFMKSYKGEIDALLSQMRVIAQEIAKAGSQSIEQVNPVKSSKSRVMADEVNLTRLRSPILTYGTLGGTVLLAGVTYLYYSGAQSSYDKYTTATTVDDAVKYWDEAESKDKTSKICSYAAIGVGAVNLASWFFRSKVHPEVGGHSLRIQNQNLSLISNGGIALTWRF